MQNKKAIVIGAGIVGLATARALCLKGYSVTIIERSEKAVGASIRNFGMLWPIGQPMGKLFNRAIRSKEIWSNIADSTGLWYNQCGSLHLAYYNDEMQVLNELNAAFNAEGRNTEILSPKQIIDQYKTVNINGLQGALYSPMEALVNPKEAIPQVATYLQEFFELNFIWGKAVTKVDTNKVWIGNQLFEADLIVICSGADFESLYPQVYEAQQITKCKLQMLRFKAENNYVTNAALCGGLSLIHYNSFKVAPSLPQLKQRYQADMPEYIKHGIHVMVSQNNYMELTVGDSHEYGLSFDPFDSAYINNLITSYLKQFANTESFQLQETWHGIYPKMTNNETEIFLQPTPGVFILNGVGGTGMTLSFGLAEEIVNTI
jgi:FAD dependent oxidoreductase TIGR03364